MSNQRASEMPPDDRSDDDRRRGDRRLSPRRHVRNGRLAQTFPFRDPDHCPNDPAHGRQTRVSDVLHHNGFIQRAHVCKVCWERWESYQTILHPLRILHFLRAKSPTG